ncbi:hydantoinase/oxoprolinase family protein [Bradyrhizobium arachidis]|uniref:hydantoinase/oxoprolinase family protein n=1 Tax=Bradyrhizobium arachidis TaxID=858423 RepID=UPI0021636313|nr:hydantoinase/oxoprolinase family protein [Bradyrhizobium arachidis]UVO35767.1 hydantoinase/oxoprolinase family protein [Bradyrhizobium arachidis]
MQGEFRTPFRIGVDIGGTFTDLVVVDAEGGVHAFKSPSDPLDPASGVLNALDLGAKRLGRTSGELLSECSLFIHGSTIATNTLLEKKGAPVGLLTTEGFRDSLEIMRGIRQEVWDHRAASAPVLVPRYLRLPIRERLGHEGEELEPLDENAVRSAVKVLRDEGVQSIAIAFLHSYRNSAHEHRAREIVKETWPAAWVTCSADVAPIIGEYERTSTAVINAYIAPRVVPYLQALEKRLTNGGLKGDVLLVQSNGGAVSIPSVTERPVQLILSGPAAATGAIHHFSRDATSKKLLSIEVGGTSCDVAMLVDGQISMVDQLNIDGYHLAVPSVEIHTVGAGGGTIARADSEGMLIVGPDGAGAKPGPAAYGLGGQRPTVTDAQLVLGRLRPGPYAGGAISLDLQRARNAIDIRLAKPLGISVEKAAAGILRLVEQNIQHAVERVSVERGHDPRGFTLLAAGGAGPLHGASVGRLLGCGAVYVPRLAGVFCAFGMCNTDVRHDYQRAWLKPIDLPGIQDELTHESSALINSVAIAPLIKEGFSRDAIAFRFGLDLRYVGQQWTVRVDTDSFAPAGIRALFEQEHERLYGYTQPNGEIEIVNLRLTAFGRTQKIEVRATETSTSNPEPVELRSVWVDEIRGTMKVPVYDGRTLAPRQEIAGPAIIDEATTTILAGFGDHLKITDANNYLIMLQAPN